jgi:UDP-N-acetylmuramoylalanine--D-glutamate ligase
VQPSSLHDQNVLVLGLGASGLAMARWCVRNGAHVTVADSRENPPELERLRRELPAARFIWAAPDASSLAEPAFSRVCKSPGLTPIAAKNLIAIFNIANYLYRTSEKSELDLFSEALADLKASQGYSPAVLAITGTNGKTTVTSLAGQLVARAGKTVAVAGNIGPTLLDTLSGCLDANALPEVWVIELSSFQLDGLQGAGDAEGEAGEAGEAVQVAFEPTAATVLNVTQDHLDWHGSLEKYAAAKAKVFGKHALMLLNRDDPRVMAMLPAPSTQGKVKDRPPQRDYITFGGSLPQRPGDFGIEEVNGMVWLVRALDADGSKRKRNEASEALYLQRLMPADALRIRGRHNAVNALAALALAASAGCSLAPMLFGLREYRGEPHRVEAVGLVNGVEFFDDSKGTNVGATVAALNGLGADRKLVVILGGDGKGQDFSPLTSPVARFARAVVLIGRDAGLIRAALETTGVPMFDAFSMPQAVLLAAEQARAGDAVLMSPACASLDMFDNYVHRAAVFREAVAQIAASAGVELEGAA